MFSVCVALRLYPTKVPVVCLMSSVLAVCVRACVCVWGEGEDTCFGGGWAPQVWYTGSPTLFGRDQSDGERRGGRGLRG